MARVLTDLIWPTLERPDLAALAAAKAAVQADVDAIEACSFAAAGGAALEEAKRLAADENDRRRGAEARASTYLLVIAALIPLLTYLEGTVWGRSFGQAPQWLSLLILAVAVVYLLGAGRWAFRTLRVGTYERVDGNDLISIWASAGSGQVEGLAKRILATSRRNRAAVNDKISGMVMSHIFLGRAILWFGILLLVQVGWYLGPCVAGWVGDTTRGLVCHPGPAIGGSPRFVSSGD